tara:strand:- start:2807 stop:3136 length:330 start_codon:yes stop_codon:yes gene_type:complete
MDKLREEMEEVKKALQLAFTTFDKYAEYHYAKETDDGLLKGRENYSIALKMADAINQLDKFIDEKISKKQVIKLLDFIEFCTELSDEQWTDINKYCDDNGLLKERWDGD